MTRATRQPWLWTNFLNIGLGIWLITAPFTFGYLDPASVGDGVLRITAERELPSVAVRGAAMARSDLVSGVLIVLLSAIAVIPRARLDFVGRWGTCFVGIWLGFAPLLFWSPSPAAFVSDTLIGVLVITFSILVPMMPGMAHHTIMQTPGPVVPSGWTYNPSSWLQRAPIITLGLVGWFISRYLAAYQLGYIDNVWDPLFGDSTMRILDSEVSRAWPVSDAGFGAFAYTFEVLMGFMGGTSRWRTMPWMVTFFGILVIPLGIVSIGLVILQPVAVGTWCTLCLVTALAMLVMIPLAVDEVVAMIQFLERMRRRGKSLWHTFWVGDTLEHAANEDRRTPPYGSGLAQLVPAMLWGVNVPRSLLASATVGAWLMAAPAVAGSGGAAANSDHLTGALVVTFAVIAMAEATRAVRYVNVPAGAWIVAAPWLLGGSTMGASINGLLVGVAVILLSLPKGAVRDRYAGWQRYIV
ncbi:MAG: vitamin K epoxide reductase family protein [Trueperaceae bacterium]